MAEFRFDTSPVSAAEFRQSQADAMLEAALQAAIIRIAEGLGWKVYHTHDSRRSQKGFPDLVLVHERQGRVLFRELKKQKRAYLTAEQKEWRDALMAVGADYDVWRPMDLLTQRIHRELAKPTTPKHRGEGTDDH